MSIRLVDGEKKTVRGCSNGNDRGNNKARRERREWLVEAYRADTDAIQRAYADGSVEVSSSPFTNAEGVLDIESGLAYWERVMERQGDLRGLWHPLEPENTIVELKIVSACRCYRCGRLLSVDTVTVDRIFPKILGGLYRTVRMDRRDRVTNIRPACGPCNSITGGELARAEKHRPAKTRAKKVVDG